MQLTGAPPSLASQLVPILDEDTTTEVTPLPPPGWGLPLEIATSCF